MTPRARVGSIDILRGAVMVLMALDHTRDFVTNLRIPPEDLSRASFALFATRWITHFCAPAFFLLAGLGIALSSSAGRATGETSRHLAIRGLWLVVLELTFTRWGWDFGFGMMPLFAIVIWALGWSMVIMAVLIRLPQAVIAGIAVVMIAGHNLLDGIAPASFGALAPLWHVLHVPGFAIPDVLLVAYTIIPWVGVMALGYAMGQVYRWEAGRRQQFLIWAGVGMIVAFLALRALNGYGNPRPWAPQPSAAMTMASFLNTQKYPPSLDFLLMTLGPAFIALALLERVRSRVTEWLEVFGRVPMFYYVVHIYLLHSIAALIALAQLSRLQRIPVVGDPASIPASYGVSLPAVYAVWAMAVLIMYFPCRWFAALKARRSDWWLRYI